MNASVIISTFRRSASLRITLQSLAQQLPVADGESWEVIVVDNEVAEATATVCGEPWPFALSYVPEPRVGKAHALNTGLRAARGQRVLLTDDDVSLPPDWLMRYFEAFRRYPDAAFFGGRVNGQLPREVPEWVGANPGRLHFLPRYEQGAAERPVRHRGELPWFIGANMAYRATALAAAGGFDHRVGPSGNYRMTGSRHGGEESVVQGKLLDLGAYGVYLPQSEVFHRDEPERLTLRYSWWYYKGYGRDEALHGVLPKEWGGGSRKLRPLLRAIGGGVVRMILGIGDSRFWYPAFVQTASAWGALRALLCEPDLRLGKQGQHESGVHAPD